MNFETDKTLFYYGVGALGVLLLLRKIFQYGSRPKGFPPGPPTIPILGNILQMPTKNFHLEFQKLAQQFGPILSMKLGGQTLVLLNDPTVVRDLIEKRSSNYSYRPDLYIRHFGENLNIAFRNNDDIWRRQRKTYHVRLNVKSADNYLPYQASDAVSHVQRYTASISTALLYGWRTPVTNTGYVKDLLEWMDVTSEAANFQLVDFYAFLRPFYHWLPYWLVSNKRKLHHLQQLEDRVFNQLLNRAKESIEAGQNSPSFIRDMLLDTSEDRLSDKQIAHNAAHGFGAAMDTSANTILGFIKAMVLFPEVQMKAQEEIDSVIGLGLIPTWDDRKDLPYIRGVVEETLRWAPSPLSAAVPHSAKAEDVYNGMTIPQGSMVMMNVWTLNHQGLKNPRDFDPLRHNTDTTLTENNAINQDSTKRLHFTFGAGRRVCPGFHVAERNLFIAISRILWGFTITSAIDAQGQPVPINRDAVTPGLIVRPEDFECTITPRSPGHKTLIENLWKESEKNLDSEGNFTPAFIDSVFGARK
ncbi:putative cytochrome P450 oxidoreductase [Plectosphaerella plurivora]|uniref:Cytochrome P450 oxidoreductase n=1 Tax=Plectosphaerella plurivora TaxID=936078 RepID=A0A9P8VLG0_9PEZI|nr:putative cytochrome P450 oxidoreductase [Plectosphaerella plurivora]